jgi:uncharacterized protein (DUF1330 family)
VIGDPAAKVLEGTTDRTRLVVIEFPSQDAFDAWYHTPEYQAVLPLRLEATTGVAYLAQGPALPG